jgi:transcriptional regulator with XRE-family HTH domain
MKRFGSICRQIREARHMSLSDVARASGLTKDTIWRAEQMDEPRLRPSTIRSLAHGLGLTIEQFEAAWRTGRAELAGTVVTTTVVAGFDGIPASPPAAIREADEHGCDFTLSREIITRSGVTDPYAFVVVVRGESMAPSIRDGDMVVVSPSVVHERGVESGRVYAVWLRDEEATLKRVYVEEGYVFRLEADNPAFEPIRLRGEEIIQMALVVGQLSLFEPLPSATGAVKPTDRVPSPHASSFNAGRGPVRTLEEAKAEIARIKST